MTDWIIVKIGKKWAVRTKEKDASQYKEHCKEEKKAYCYLYKKQVEYFTNSPTDKLNLLTFKWQAKLLLNRRLRYENNEAATKTITKEFESGGTPIDEEDKIRFDDQEDITRKNADSSKRPPYRGDKGGIKAKGVAPKKKDIPPPIRMPKPDITMSL